MKDGDGKGEREIEKRGLAGEEEKREKRGGNEKRDWVEIIEGKGRLWVGKGREVKGRQENGDGGCAEGEEE